MNLLPLLYLALTYYSLPQVDVDVYIDGDVDILL
jgi:hypothetical protein